MASGCVQFKIFTGTCCCSFYPRVTGSQMVSGIVELERHPSPRGCNCSKATLFSMVTYSTHALDLVETSPMFKRQERLMYLKREKTLYVVNDKHSSFERHISLVKCRGNPCTQLHVLDAKIPNPILTRRRDACFFLFLGFPGTDRTVSAFGHMILFGFLGHAICQ